MGGDQLDVLAVGVEQPRGIEVPAAAIERRDVLRDRLLDERMDEAQRLAGQQHLDPGQGIGGGGGGFDRQSGQRRRAPQRHVGAEDGHRAGQRRDVRTRAGRPAPAASG